MAFLIAWAIYLSMAALLMVGFERYLAGHIPAGQGRLIVRCLLAVILFTPGVVSSAEGLHVVPACIGVLFNILARSGTGLMKAMLPLLISSTVVFALVFLREILRKTSDAETETVDKEPGSSAD